MLLTLCQKVKGRLWWHLKKRLCIVTSSMQSLNETFHFINRPGATVVGQYFLSHWTLNKSPPLIGETVLSVYHLVIALCRCCFILQSNNSKEDDFNWVTIENQWEWSYMQLSIHNNFNGKHWERRFNIRTREFFQRWFWERNWLKFKPINIRLVTKWSTEIMVCIIHTCLDCYDLNM